MKSKIKREHFKHNFLKKIIVRFDYTGVVEADIEDHLSKLHPYLKKKGYNIFRSEFSTEMDFQVEDPEYVEAHGLPVKEIRKQKAYIYENTENGVIIKLSAWYAYVSIESKKYVSFSQYSEELLGVIKILKENLDFMHCTRFGIRKINQCIIKDLQLLNDYFEEQYFKVFAKENNHISKLYQVKDCYLDDGYNVNLGRTIITGEYRDSLAHQIIIDSDIYVTNSEKINELVDNIAYINDMNGKLFELYKGAITEKFISILGMEVYIDSNIIGVSSNE